MGPSWVRQIKSNEFLDDYKRTVIGSVLSFAPV